ncbi:hypothetical protein KA037_01460 [Patescibacteria group bacterium]|nr:hypothetical protein [Patescibacteria group bacterium]MBP7841330.1 hypothetical protein [Patescibacteria group bacterium]
MVENTIKTKNGGKEVTQKDIDAFINGELTIDKTIENVFGAVYAKPETFR